MRSPASSIENDNGRVMLERRCMLSPGKLAPDLQSYGSVNIA